MLYLDNSKSDDVCLIRMTQEGDKLNTAYKGECYVYIMVVLD